MRWPARRSPARSRNSRTSGSSGFLGDLLEVFQPSRRHVVEEQERRRDHAQLPESGAPPVIDLDRGIVHLPPPPPHSDPPAER